jgi:hypothetical protein
LVKKYEILQVDFMPIIRYDNKKKL